MSEYKKITHFISAVENNNLEEVKVELIKIIKYFYLKPKEIELAISFARSNSDFDFDNHKNLPFEDVSKKEEFDSEYLNLFENFSKQRYQRVIELLPDWSIEDSVFKESFKKSENNKSSLYKTIFLVLIAVLFIFILFKIVKK